MGDKTGISWTDATWNCVRGCSRVSAGCERCYAETQAARIVRMGKGAPTSYDGLVKLTKSGEAKWTGEVRMIPEHLADPLKWKKPRRIFVNSMSDLFHEKLTNEQIAAVFGVMAAAPQHTFQVLTKRAKRMRDWFEWIDDEARRCANGIDPDEGWLRAHVCVSETHQILTERNIPTILERTWPLPNVWLGVSVENQKAANERVPELLRTPAAVRFLSCEPLLGPVDLATASPNARSLAEDLDWLIAGCESGRKARACSVEWLRSLRDQCKSAGVPYFLKQAVETTPGRCGDADNPNGDNPCGERIRVFVNGPGDGSWSCGCTVEGPEFGSAVDVGAGDGSKRKGGGVIELPYLDGVQHAAFPEIA